ncbi:MAG: helix-turn-helix domain-containing protein [Candidatus Omnitrophica bacterium]|nr:helix-turn-helix domain-containing protein [Candidatus Omnitrophota bacterium]
MYDNNKILEIIKYYFDKGSLRKTAKKFGIHYNTLWKWVKKYKRAKDVNDFINYRKPWNRIKGEIEQRVINLKENYPLLSLRKAKRILEKEGIELSVKCIWRTWKRAGFCGFEKTPRLQDLLNIFLLARKIKFLLIGQRFF